LRADLTNELKQAIAHIIQSGYRQSGIGVPLVNRDMTAAAAHVDHSDRYIVERQGECLR
jgi:hypothetical protein